MLLALNQFPPLLLQTHRLVWVALRFYTEVKVLVEHTNGIIVRRQFTDQANIVNRSPGFIAIVARKTEVGLEAPKVRPARRAAYFAIWEDCGWRESVDNLVHRDFLRDSVGNISIDLPHLSIRHIAHIPFCNNLHCERFAQ